MTLEGRVALVTGGGRGIGRAVALALANAGADLALTARTVSEIEAVAAEVRARGRRAAAVAGDVADPASVARVVTEATRALGPVAILVNNAGMAVAAKVTEVDDALWARHLAVNLTGAFYMTRAVLPGMLAARWGRIVNVASAAARQGYPYVAPYVASKHGLLGLTRAVAMEVVAAGITVNAVCPGYAATDLTRDSARRIELRTGRSYEEALRGLAAFSPQKRLVEPEEVATLVVLLASDEARGITAQAWGVDGGQIQA